MKRLMRFVLILNLVVVNGLTAAAAAGAGAGQAKAAAQNRVEIPSFMPNAVHFGRSEVIMKWLNDNPSNKNAIYTIDGTTVLMLLIQFYDRGLAQAFSHLIAMKPNTLIQNSQGKDVLDILINNIHLSNAKRKEIARVIVPLMLAQGANIQTLLQRIRAKKDEFEKLIEQLKIADENPMVDEKRNAQAQYDLVSDIIGLLEKELDKLELKAANEALITEGHLVSDIGRILAPSDPRLLAIKHAIEDNDAKKLAQALEGNKWLEIKDATGYTPFLYAAYIGKPDMMRDLIRRGADTNAQTKDGAQAKDFGEYKKLIDEERLEKERKEEEARKLNHERMENEKKLLFENIKHYERRTLSDDPVIVNSRDEKGYTPLMLAASLGKTWYVQQLLYTSDKSLKDSDGNTALHIAILNGHYNIANLLISKMDKRSIDLKNRNGFTAYDLAARYADKYKDDAHFMKVMDAFKSHGYPQN